jgi:tRNA modification GTPase
MRQMEGGAATFIRQASDDLYALQAGLAACIDYPEEISDEEGAGELRPGIRKLIRFLREAVDEKSSRLLENGLRVALCGRPNVGKSSLLNALLGEDRAIVTEIPGTTRDTLQGEMLLDGVRVVLTDTAGLRQTEDPVEKIGVARSEKALREADVRALVLDLSEPLTGEEAALAGTLEEGDILVLNKADLPRRLSEDALREAAPGIPAVTLSAKDPSTLEPLKRLLRQRTTVSDRMIVAQPRHVEAVLRAARHLEDALRTLDCMTPDVASVDLQAAQAALGEITGDQADEKLLDAVFSRFCVGK